MEPEGCSESAAIICNGSAHNRSDRALIHRHHGIAKMVFSHNVTWPPTHANYLNHSIRETTLRKLLAALHENNDLVVINKVVEGSPELGAQTRTTCRVELLCVNARLTPRKSTSVTDISSYNTASYLLPGRQLNAARRHSDEGQQGCNEKRASASES